MFFNSLKIAWRNLFRNRVHSIVNMGGLLIGFTIGILILLVVYDQLSYDRFHINKDRLYQAYQVFGRKTGDDYVSQFGFPAAPTFRGESQSISRATRFAFGGRNVIYNDKELDIPVMLVNEALHQQLLYRNIRHDYIIRPGAHNWEYWSEAVHYQLLFMHRFFKGR